mmetsp:Transcript_53311/g.159635  ORF Transcript_53311/g.159635 Transcript_53311/m.159635 type:complete len:94 (-) Transcript_53311:373-654(-)
MGFTHGGPDKAAVADAAEAWREDEVAAEDREEATGCPEATGDPPGAIALAGATGVAAADTGTEAAWEAADSASVVEAFSTDTDAVAVVGGEGG